MVQQNYFVPRHNVANGVRGFAQETTTGPKSIVRLSSLYTKPHNPAAISASCFSFCMASACLSRELNTFNRWMCANCLWIHSHVSQKTKAVEKKIMRVHVRERGLWRDRKSGPADWNGWTLTISVLVCVKLVFSDYVYGFVWHLQLLSLGKSMCSVYAVITATQFVECIGQHKADRSAIV